MINNSREYELMSAFESKYWWYKLLHKRTLQRIKKHFSNNKDITIMDAGCGTGGLLLKLQESGYKKISGFDISDDAIEHCLLKNLKINKYALHEIEEKISPTKLDVIIAHDNLLYYPDSWQSVVDKMLACLNPDGILLINVPAYDAFRGTHDISVGIQKRFTKRNWKTLSKNKEIRVSMTHWPFIVSPLIWLTRFLQRQKPNTKIESDLKPIPSFINSALYLIGNIEFYIPFKFTGSSLFIQIVKK